MIERLCRGVAAAVVLCTVAPSIAFAQQQRPASDIGVAGYATLGRMNFTADQSFDAILGDSGGPIMGGGIRIDLRMGGWFFDVGAWRFQRTGERAFIFQDQVIPLGVPVEVTARAIELMGGWRFLVKRRPRLIPYLAGGMTSLLYREETEFSTSLENDDKTFYGLVARAGAEYKITRWLGVGGEGTWTTVPDAIGEAGVSKAFNEDDLGGVSVRFKITIGQ